jgi:peptidoglycan/LPS O-acetylase OafA/YrhL
MKFSPLFAAGISFYQIWKVQKFSLLNMSILSLSFYLIYLQGGADIRFYSVVGFFGVFLLCIFSKMAWIRISPLIYLGKISYALYLIHQFLGYGIISYLTSKGVNFNYAVMAAIIISVLIAGLMTRFIEQNSIKFIKSSWENYKQRKAHKITVA